MRVLRLHKTVGSLLPVEVHSLLREEWVAASRDKSHNLSVLFHICEGFLQGWVSRIKSFSGEDPYICLLLSYFRSFPDGLRRLRSLSSLPGSDLYQELCVILAELFRSQLVFWKKIRPHKVAFLLSRLFILSLKDLLRKQRVHPRKYTQNNTEEEVTLPIEPTMFPIGYWEDIYSSEMSETELAELLHTYPVDAGRKKRLYLRRLRERLKGL
jgi:hypothetical protein